MGTIRANLWECAGWCGALLLLLAYALRTQSLLQDGMAYHLMNLVGALAVGKVALGKKSYPAAFVEFAWAAIALFALVQPLMR